MTGPDWIAMRCEDNRNDRRRSLCRLRPGCRRRYDEVHVEADQLGGKVRQPLKLFFSISVLEGDGLPLHPAQVSQCLSKRFNPGDVRRGHARREDPDEGDFARRLGFGGERRGGRSDEPYQEGSSMHADGSLTAPEPSLVTRSAL